MNDIQLRIKFGPDYFKRLNTDPGLLNAKDVLQWEFLAAWIEEHAPGCELHLSGGEPLARPDIESGVRLLTDRGLSVSILTNGMLIPERPELLNMPIRWHVTHHAQNRLDRFLAAVEPIRTRPHLLTRVLVGNNVYKHRATIEKSYSRFNFSWKGCNRPRPEDMPEGLPGADRVASSVLHFVTPDGRVFPCNCLSWGEIGHLYLGTYDPEKARQIDRAARRCILAGNCGAYVTASQMTAL